MSSEKNKKYVINPQFKLRNEKKKVLIYKIDLWTGEPEKYQCFHPVIGVLLSLFDGKKTYREVANLWAYITCSELSEAKRIENIDNYINFVNSVFQEEVLIKKDQISNFSVYDPLNFIIDKSNIDLSDNRLSFPLSINYDVTFNCNRNCLYCYSENEFAPLNKHLSFERIKELLEECRRNGVVHITLAGGEPFCRKDIINIISEILNKKINVFVSTKAFLSEKICASLKEIGLEKIQVSIDSSDEKLANFITRSSNFLQEINKTIENLIKFGISIRYKAVITSYNIYNIPNLLQFLATKNAKIIHLSLYGRSMYRHKDVFFISREQAEWLLPKVNEFRNAHPDIKVIYGGWDEEPKNIKEKEKLFNKRAICSVGRSAINVLPDGKVSFCEQLPSIDDFIYGDLSYQSIAEVWDSPKLKELLLPNQRNLYDTPCFGCPDYFECNWIKGRCIRDAYHVFKKKYAPDPRCPKVKIAFRMT